MFWSVPSELGMNTNSGPPVVGGWKMGIEWPSKQTRLENEQV